MNSVSNDRSENLSPAAPMTTSERGTLLAILGVYMMRMLGLFMLLPVLSLYAATLHGATPLLVGMAVGAYGISQAVLQIPFGWASDRFGRRRLLIIGLVIFAGGSLVAALSTSVYGVIAGRVLQGAGAISAVLSALVGDVIPMAKRTRAMAIIGISIGMAFMLSLVLGPLIGGHIGVSGLFFVSTGFALTALLITVLWLPDPPRQASAGAGYSLAPVLADRTLWRLNFGIFALHFVLAALFVAMPFLLRDQVSIAAEGQWRAIGVAILLSIPGTVLLIRSIERGDYSTAAIAAGHRMTSIAIALLLVVMLCLSIFSSQLDAGSYWLVVALLALFFSGFNFLEAHLPAQVTFASGESQRGAALGVYASCQFFGIFAGGALAGLAMGFAGNRAVFVLCGVLCFFWFASHIFMRDRLLQHADNQV